MPAPTFTPGNNKQDEQLNPGARDYQRTFEDIARNEEAGTFDDIANNYDKTADPSQEDANIQKIKDEEANGDTPGDWTNNTTPKSKQSVKGKSWVRKSAPFLGIGGGLGVGGLLFTVLFSPNILFVQIKETMVNKFNTQLSAMELRSSKLLNAKISNTTKGFCSNSVSIRCKFSSMSEKQIKKFADAGIEVRGDSETAIRGRLKPTEFIWGGKSISASEFTSRLNTDPAFRSAVRQAYNPKYAGFTGKAWGAVASKFKINKKLPELDAASDKEKARTRISDISREGAEDTGGTRRVTASDAECEGSRCISQEQANTINSNAEAIESSGTNKSAASDVRAKLSNLQSAPAISIFKITGVVDNACQIYGAINALSYAGKVIRAAQMVRYFMIFASVADAIKAGDSPDPADVSLLGDIATSTVKDSTDPTKVISGSLTDSFGYKYAAYGDSGASEQSMNIANRFVSGGGFLGDLSDLSTQTVAFLGGRQAAHNTCQTLANPFVQGGSLVLGVASLLLPGVNIGKAAAGIALGVGVSVAIAVLPSLLADTLAGTVTDGISGEEAGNAMASGAGALMSDSLAAQNGAAPMSKSDAIAYNSFNSSISDQYIADELQNTSPFDPTNPHTFAGRVASALTPLTVSSNPLSAIGSLLTGSLKAITPTTKAASQEQYAKSLEVCQDLDVLDAGYAADPFCNMTRGIPERYLNRDPNDVATDLINRGLLSEAGKPQGEYSEFIKKCITNETPIGYSDLESGFSPDEAQACIINDSNANYYLNYMDQRINLGMDDEDTIDGAGSSEAAGTTIDMEHIFEDSSGVACAAGTDEAGVVTGYVAGAETQINTCSIPNTSQGGKPMIVNSRISGAINELIKKMSADLNTSPIKIGDAFRPFENQVHAIQCAIRKNYQPKNAYYGYSAAPAGTDCSDIAGRAAKPGSSIHGSGLAIDFQLQTGNSGTSKPGDPIWDWLSANAGNYGFKQLPAESWHWSVTGG